MIDDVHVVVFGVITMLITVLSVVRGRFNGVSSDMRCCRDCGWCDDTTSDMIACDNAVVVVFDCACANVLCDVVHAVVGLN